MGLQKAKVEGLEDDKYIDNFVKKRDQKFNEKEIQQGHWSGAKTVEGEMSLEIALPRLKSGRSDMADEQRSLSMSCSDKILMWNIMGFQGSIIKQKINQKLVLSSIIVEVENICDENFDTIKRGIIPKCRLNCSKSKVDENI